MDLSNGARLSHMNAHQRTSTAEEVLSNQMNEILSLLEVSFGLFPSHHNVGSNGRDDGGGDYVWARQHGLPLIRAEQQ